MRVRQWVPLLIGLLLAAGVAVAARFFITWDVPDQVTLVTAAVPLYPGDVLVEEKTQQVIAYTSPAIRGVIRAEEFSRYSGGTVLMYIPAGAAIPRTAILPSGQITAAGRLSTVLVEGEQLLSLRASERIQAPPFASLRPGDCLDVVAFFKAPMEGSPLAAPAGALEVTNGPPTITATVPITVPGRPLAKWLARGVVRSVLDLPPPGGGGTTAPTASAPQLLLGIPQSAVEGIVYALGAAETIHLVLAPPCARAEIPRSPGFADADLEQWIRAGRGLAGAPNFFLPEGNPVSAPNPSPASQP